MKTWNNVIQTAASSVNHFYPTTLKFTPCCDYLIFYFVVRFPFPATLLLLYSLVLIVLYCLWCSLTFRQIDYIGLLELRRLNAYRLIDWYNPQIKTIKICTAPRIEGAQRPRLDRVHVHPSTEMVIREKWLRYRNDENKLLFYLFIVFLDRQKTAETCAFWDILC